MKGKKNPKKHSLMVLPLESVTKNNINQKLFLHLFRTVVSFFGLF